MRSGEQERKWSAGSEASEDMLTQRDVSRNSQARHSCSFPPSQFSVSILFSPPLNSPSVILSFLKLRNDMHGSWMIGSCVQSQEDASILLIEDFVSRECV